MKYIDVDKILNDSLFHTWKKKDLVQALKDAETMSLECFCTSNRLAYNAPMRRTSFRTQEYVRTHECPKICVNSISGANRAKFNRGSNCSPYLQHNASGTGYQGLWRMPKF